MEQRPEWSVVKNWQRGRGKAACVCWGSYHKDVRRDGKEEEEGRGRKQDRGACGRTGGGRVLTGSK